MTCERDVTILTQGAGLCENSLAIQNQQLANFRVRVRLKALAAEISCSA